ncbi:MAG: hypothetical protein ACI9JR_002215 [Gammaproteobacteria bacterium]|jgi:hypothetical protein
MAFTINTRQSIGCLLLLLTNQLLAAPVGLNTRDQNPMFQAYYLPSINLVSEQGWQVSHTAYVTNAFQNNQEGNETLMLDVENYRYDFSLAYQHNNWRLGTTVPLIFNEGGILDDAIEDWHDFFGLPQGGRTSQPHNQVNIDYSRNGQTFFKQSTASNDIGDIAVSLSYSFTNTAAGSGDISFAIDLPTGSIANSSGNEAIDAAIWLTQSHTLANQSSLYGLFGFSFLGKGGQLESLQNSTVWVGQLGLDYPLYPGWTAILQLDAHSAIIRGSELRALGNSYQVQIGLRLNQLIENHDVDLFFSEDILPGSAPDITFGIRLYLTD